jgi:hypothetical protein
MRNYNVWAVHLKTGLKEKKKGPCIRVLLSHVLGGLRISSIGPYDTKNFFTTDAHCSHAACVFRSPDSAPESLCRFTVTFCFYLLIIVQTLIN